MYDDFLARIVEPDVFLPSQFYGSGGLSRQLDGEKRLMIAILKDAVECLNKYRGARSSLGSSQYQNALEWIEDEGTEWLFSFNNICDLLGFDPDYLRKVLIKKEGRHANSVRGKIYSFPVASGASRGSTPTSS
ncbi:MAG TPA: hypothetical protein VFP18_14265 [Candidatus Binatia bacterium]|nr:hypothetical protein [Candidatus Binatia bacterium]